MHRSLPGLRCLIVTAVVVATVGLGAASAASADDWARDDAGANALVSLDPAIRTAIAARHLDAAATVGAEARTPALDDGFAWGAAALGVGVGIAAMCVLLGCVTLVRHDGRLRNA